MQLKSPYIINWVYVWTKHGGSCRLGTLDITSITVRNWKHSLPSQQKHFFLDADASFQCTMCCPNSAIYWVVRIKLHSACLLPALLGMAEKREVETAGAASKRKSVPLHTFRMTWGRQTSDWLYEEWWWRIMDSQMQNTREKKIGWKSRTPD